MTFIIIAAAMLLVALGFIAIPLLKRRQAVLLPAAAVNREVHDARLRELRADVETGALAQADYAAARHDLEADFARTAAPAKDPGRSYGWIAAVAVVAIVPVLTGVLYLDLGSWRSALYGNDSLPAMIANTRARLAQTPNQINGWEFLAEAYSASRQYDRAADAYRHALSLSDGKDADLLAAYGEAKMLAHPQQLDPAAGSLFDRVLKLDPNNPRGLWYGGMIALHDGHQAVAVQRFQRLLTQNPPPAIKRVLTAQIKAAGDSMSAPASPAPAAAASAIDVRLTIAPALRSKLDAGATLFVFVRPADETGGPPLAVKRLTGAAFPVAVQLSDANAMIPGRHLEDYKKLRVVARVSRSGQPLQQAGDIYGSQEFAWRNDDKPLQIVLDQVAK